MIRTYLSIVSEQQYHNLIKPYVLTVTIVSSDPTSSRSHHIVINVVTLLRYSCNTSAHSTNHGNMLSYNSISRNRNITILQVAVTNYHYFITDKHGDI